MKLPLHRRIGRSVFPTGRVPFPCLDPKIYEARLNDRWNRLPVFIQHRMRFLIVENCHMVLEAEAGGAYRGVLKHLLNVIRHDLRSMKWAYRERLRYCWLRLSGWDQTAISIKYEAEMEAELEEESYEESK
jgi:hypothetical protein